MLQCAAFAGPPEPDFSFSAFLLPARPLACVDGLAFSHPVSPLSWFRSQLAHTGPTGPIWGFAGVVPLPGPQSRTQGHTGASLVFLRRTSLPLPLKGEGRGIVFLGLALLVHSWATLAQQGLFGASLVSFPYPAHKIAHRLSQDRVLVFTVFFSHLFSSVIPLVAAPGGNSLPREWGGSCKAASRFSQCRPMSTPLSAAFR